MPQRDGWSPPESFQEHRDCALGALKTLGWVEILRGAIASVLLNSRVIAGPSITDENTRSLFQTECCLIAGAEQKGARVQRILKKRITSDGYYRVIIVGQLCLLSNDNRGGRIEWDK